MGQENVNFATRTCGFGRVFSDSAVVLEEYEPARLIPAARRRLFGDANPEDFHQVDNVLRDFCSARMHEFEARYVLDATNASSAQVDVRNAADRPVDAFIPSSPPVQTTKPAVVRKSASFGKQTSITEYTSTRKANPTANFVGAEKRKLSDDATSPTPLTKLAKLSKK